MKSAQEIIEEIRDITQHEPEYKSGHDPVAQAKRFDGTITKVLELVDDWLDENKKAAQ